MMKLVRPVATLALASAMFLSLGSLARAAEEQRRFDTPEAAANALIEAVGDEDPEALAAILGPGTEELGSGDAVADATERREFIAAAEEATGIEPHGDDRALLTIGAQDWPFPIPLVRTEAGWAFDLEAGKEELLNRRIGRNELHAIAVARAFVEAEYEYYDQDPDGDGAKEFAQKLLSSEGARDGLYWPTSDNEPESPMGALVAEARAEGYGENPEDVGPRPYHGYLYDILTSQGEHAPGGARDYVKDGRMTAGFGLIAYPATYGNSGIMTFIVNQSGILFQKDLGDETEGLASVITSFDPDRSWEPVTD
jgi:hypothetical protein